MSEYPSNYRAHTSSKISPDFTIPATRGITPAHLSQTNPAKWAYLKLIECIYEFEKNLDDDHEIGARVSFPSETTFYIQEVSYHGPHMVSVSGCNEAGNTLQLVQHVSQLSVFLVAIKKRGEEPVRIGFKLKRTAEEER